MPDFLRLAKTEFGFYSKCSGKTLWDFEKGYMALSNLKNSFCYVNIDG